MRGLGDTWRPYTGSRRGFQVRTRHGGIMPTTRRTTWADMGDALDEAARAEREKVNAEAGDYRLPARAGSRSQAIMAYILLMRSAAAEDARNAGHYKSEAASAAWDYRSAPIWNILSAARDQTKNAPRTHQLAEIVYQASTSTSAARAPARVPRAREREVSLPPATVESAELSWRDRLPSWAPAAAAGTAAVLLAFLLIPGRPRGVPA